MAWTLTINGVDRTAMVQKRSLKITRSRGSRASMTLTIQDKISDATAYRPTVNDVAVLTVDGTVRFQGDVTEAADAPLGGLSSGTATQITVTYIDEYLDRAFISYTFTVGMTMKAIATYIQTTYLAVFGVTLDAAMVAGPALTSEMPVIDATPREIFDALHTLTGWLVRLTPTKELQFFALGTKASAYTLSRLTCRTSLPWRKSRGQYANQILVRYTAAATKAYGYIATSGGNVSNGEQVHIGSRTYTFQTVLTDVDGNVKIGATVDDTLRNLTWAVNGGPGQGTEIATSTHAHPDVEAAFQITNRAIVVARTAGASGNSIGLTASAHTIWFTEGGISIAALALGSDEALTNTVLRQDAADVALRGPFPKRVTAAWIHDQTLAEEFGDGELRKAKQFVRTLQAGTDAGWLLEGDAMSLNAFAHRLVSGDWTVDSLSIDLKSPTRFYFVITFVEGLSLPTSWGESVRQLTGGGSATTSGIGLSVSTSSGGGAPSYFLGGSPNESVHSSTWVAASPMVVTLNPTTRGSSAVRVRGRIKTRTGGITVTPRLRNVTTSTDAGVGAALVTTTSWQPFTFLANLTAGDNDYQLELLSATADEQMQAIAYVE